MYKFHLETVLKYRESVEKSHIQEMSRLKSDLKLEEKTLSECEEKTREAATQLSEEEKKGISPAEAKLYKSFILGKRSEISDRGKKISVLKEGVEVKRSDLHLASRDKKVMERLKEKKRDHYYEELRRKDQKAMDEFAGSGFIRKNKDNAK